MFSISTTPIDTAATLARVEDPTCGGLVIFEGRVRNHHRGRDVLRLDYEAFPSMAESEGNKIVAAALEKFDVRAIACVHRTGSLAIGDVAVVVAVSAAHREAAFDACRYVIDELKATVPIWKKEFYADGSDEWTGCDACAGRGHHHVH
jgi:molybdopterin synthase catalytic subunit